MYKYKVNVEVDETTYSWLQTLGDENSSVVLSRLAKWGCTMANDPIFKAITDPTNNSNNNLDRSLQDMMSFIKETMQKEWESVLGKINHERQMEMQSVVMTEKMRAEDASRTARAAMNQSEEKSRELESLRSTLALMQKQANARGTYGENMIERLIGSKYTFAEVINMGCSGDHDSDIHVRMTAEGHFISIESKCRKQLRSSNVSKSVSDAKNLKLKHGEKYIGHLFVSLEFPNIPDKGSMHIEYDVVDGATIAWVGLSQLEGNEDLVLYAFDVIWKSQGIHKQLAQYKSIAGEESAYDTLLRYVKELGQGMCQDIEAYLNIIRDYAEQRKLNARLTESMKYMLVKRMKDYESVCARTGCEMRVVVSGKKDEAILRSVLGNDTPCVTNKYAELTSSTDDSAEEPSVPRVALSPNVMTCDNGGVLSSIKLEKRGAGRKRDVSTLVGLKGKV